MKQKLLLFMLSLFLIINVTGCSVGRFTQTRIMAGVKKINKTDLKLDFQLDYNPSNRSISINLAHQPYAIYKPKISLIDMGLGLAAVGIWGTVFYSNWDHDDTFDFTDDTFDWDDSELWEKIVLIGVPADILLYWTLAYPIDWKKTKLTRQPLSNHPYRIELPDHGNLGMDYHTITGDEEIVINKFLTDLGNPPYLNNVNSLRFRVYTEDSGLQHKRFYTAPVPPIPSVPPNGDNNDDKIGIDTEWLKNPISAGEKAILTITVNNTSKTELTDLIAKTKSTDPNFDNFELPFGNISIGKSETNAIGFSTDTETSDQDITVNLSFHDSTGIDIQKTTEKLTIKKLIQ